MATAEMTESTRAAPAHRAPAGSAEAACAGCGSGSCCRCWPPEAAWGASQVAPLLRPTEQPIEPRAIPIGVSALGRLAPHGEVIKVAPGQRRRRRTSRPAAGRRGRLGASRAGRGHPRPLPPPRGRGAAGTGPGRRRPGQAGAGAGRTQARGSSGQGSAHQPLVGRSPRGRARPGAIVNSAQARRRLAPGIRRSDPQV